MYASKMKIRVRSMFHTVVTHHELVKEKTKANFLYNFE